MDPGTILGIAAGLAILGGVAWGLYQLRTGMQAKRGEREREADLHEANEGIARRSRALDLRALVRRMRERFGRD